MMKERVNISRREFLIRTTKVGVGVGAGFSLGFYLPGCSDKSTNTTDTKEPTATPSSVTETATEVPEVNAWVVIEKPE